MQKFRSYTSLLLLAVFILPQLGSGLHYLMVPHGRVEQYSKNYLHSSVDTSHACHYHLQGFTALLPTDFLVKAKKPVATAPAEIFVNLENYIQQPNFNYLLRGPPTALLA